VFFNPKFVVQILSTFFTPSFPQVIFFVIYMPLYIFAGYTSVVWVKFTPHCYRNSRPAALLVTSHKTVQQKS